MAIDIFLREDGILLSNEQAINALEAFADLFLAFVDKKEAPVAFATEPSVVLTSQFIS